MMSRVVYRIKWRAWHVTYLNANQSKETTLLSWIPGSPYIEKNVFQAYVIRTSFLFRQHHLGNNIQISLPLFLRGTLRNKANAPNQKPGQIK